MCHFERGRDEDGLQPSRKKNAQFVGVTCEEENAMIRNNAEVLEDEAIATISGSAKDLLSATETKQRQFAHSNMCQVLPLMK